MCVVVTKNGITTWELSDKCLIKITYNDDYTTKLSNSLAYITTITCHNILIKVCNYIKSLSRLSYIHFVTSPPPPQDDIKGSCYHACMPPQNKLSAFPLSLPFLYLTTNLQGWICSNQRVSLAFLFFILLSHDGGRWLAIVYTWNWYNAQTVARHSFSTTAWLTSWERSFWLANATGCSCPSSAYWLNTAPKPWFKTSFCNQDSR